MQLLPVNGDVKGLITTRVVCTISWLIRTLGEHRYITQPKQSPNPAPPFAFYCEVNFEGQGNQRSSGLIRTQQGLLEIILAVSLGQPSPDGLSQPPTPSHLGAL